MLPLYLLQSKLPKKSSDKSIKKGEKDTKVKKKVKKEEATNKKSKGSVKKEKDDKTVSILYCWYQVLFHALSLPDKKSLLLLVLGLFASV